MAYYNLFKPSGMVDSIYNITPEQLDKHGFKGVMADLDNTLIAWNSPSTQEVTVRWIDRLNLHNIPFVILSNANEKRVEPVAKELDIEFVSTSLKPLNFGFKRAQKLLNLPKEEILMVGDQVMTDILGGNLFGVDTILVRPIVETDGGLTNINRMLERLVMKKVLHKNPDMQWRESFDESFESRYD